MVNNPIFKPPEVTKDNYDAGAVAWAFVTLKYGKPLGPRQNEYDPFYVYTCTVHMNEQEIDHVWFPNVDEHKIIQMAGAANGSQLAVTYVKEDKRKGLVVSWVAGAKTERNQATVDEETNAALLAMAGPQGQQGALSTTILPPQQPQVAPPPGPVTPPQATAPPLPTTRVPPPTTTPPATTAPPPEPVPHTGNAGRNVYIPKTHELEYWELMAAVGEDASNLRRLAYNRMEKAFEDVLPPLPALAKNASKAAKEEARVKNLERANILVNLSAPVNMQLKDETRRMWDSGNRTVLARPTATSDSKDGSLELIGDMHPDNYQDDGKALIKQWLVWTADAMQEIGSWRHAANICKLIGVDSTALVDDFDTTVLQVYTQAIWVYEGARTEGLERDDALNLVAKEYDLPTEVMQFESNE